MSSSGEKVILGFSERLAIDQGLRALGEASSAGELEQRARQLAALGNAVIGPMMRQLDSDNPTLRGGLGLLASLLDRSAITPILLQAASDAQRPPAARLTAIMILERYLNQEIDPHLAQTLPAADIARQSAEEALRLAVETPTILVEYTQQLLAEPPEIVRAVVNVIAELDTPDRARLLQTIAAYGDPGLARHIIEILGGIRHPLALQALHVLRALLAPELTAPAERYARKLRLAGVHSPRMGDLRALWSPPNAQGQSLLWIIRAHALPADPDFANLVLHDALGILHIATQSATPPGSLPPPAPPGHIHRLRVPGSHHIVYLAEIAPAFGIDLMTRAAHALQANALPWPPELIVHADWFWGGEPASLVAPWPELPPPIAGAPDSFDALLQHIAFSAWTWEIADSANSSAPPLTLNPDADAIRQAAAHMLAPNSVQRLQRRLHRQAQWLLLIGDHERAGLVSAILAAIAAGQSDHPFLIGLARRSLLTAAAERIAQGELRSYRSDTPPD